MDVTVMTKQSDDAPTLFAGLEKLFVEVADTIRIKRVLTHWGIIVVQNISPNASACRQKAAGAFLFVGWGMRLGLGSAVDCLLSVRIQPIVKVFFQIDDFSTTKLGMFRRI